MMSQPMQIEFHSGELSVRKCTIADLEPVLDMLDTLLGNDYFFRRKHMEGLLQRPNTRVISVHHNGETCGLMILYNGTVLHNLYLTPSHRGMGIGTALLKTFRPEVIRSKGNMSAGDPCEFYNKAGYAAVTADPARPHIVLMEPATTPEKKDVLAKARAAQVAKRARTKLLLDRQRLIDQGVAITEIDRIMPLPGPDGGMPQGTTHRQPSTPRPTSPVADAPPSQQQPSAGPVPPPAPSPAAAPGGQHAPSAAATVLGDPPLDAQLWLSAE
jgi:GNAT superfamily N-acetyltransferase